MATCPKGHQSATLDYCEVCGAPIAGAAAGPPAPVVAPAAATAPAPAVEPAPVAAPPAEESPGKPCPVCGTPQAGRFCEEDGYDFLLAPPVSSTPSPAPAEPPAAAPVGPGWQVVVHADRAYFDTVVAANGEDAGALTFPPYLPERRFPLRGKQMLIGRYSRSRGVQPDIDLVGPPEDPGVSHVHALLVALPDGWAVVDLESANGTYLNDPSSAPIPAHNPVPVKDGDRIYLGAWTALTVQGPG